MWVNVAAWDKEKYYPQEIVLAGSRKSNRINVV
jgi:hypothetical protein